MIRSSLAVVSAVLLAIAAACSGQSGPQRTPPSDARRVDPSKAGRLAGRVAIEGQVPPNEVVQVGSDAVCARQNKDGLPLETIAAENGGLNNVFVYVKDGLAGYYFDPPTESVKVDQQACRYRPHVFGVQVGQPVEIANSDPTLHNVGAVAKANRQISFSQPLQGLKNTVTFEAPEVMVRLKCDVHLWMNAYAGVLEHPYFAVTSGGGQFELKNVPAGTYTVEAWHEKFGSRTQSVTLAENGSQTVNFTFRSSSTTP